jgi:indole-3-glycerol phosphate synthase
MTRPRFIAPDLLAAIVAATRARVAAQQEREPRAALETRAARRVPDGTAFRAALADRSRLNIIAECKRRSPSRGVLRAGYDPIAIARAYAEAGAAALSILTEPMFFDGSLDHLAQVRDAVSTPILRKDFIVDEYQLLEARACGADAVLLIVSALDDAALVALRRTATEQGLATLVEVHDEDEVTRAVDAGADLIGVNNRNLRTLDVDTRASEACAARIPEHVIAISESGLKTAADLDHMRALGYRAFLIGERFMTASEPGAALSELRAGLGATRHADRVGSA